jgi:formylmethanofuran dehydrogenase subunit C
MPLQLSTKHKDCLPIDVAQISPQIVRGLRHDEVGGLEILRGSRTEHLGNLFEISGTADADGIHWTGDLANVHSIAATMTDGRVTIRGTAGRHVAAQMSGGTVTVEGDVGDHVAAELAGGIVRVHGNAADWAGGGYDSERYGMRGGTLIIDGSTGHHTGRRMRRGLIFVGKSCGSCLGENMLAGTIVVGGQVGADPGIGMRRGSLLFYQQAQLPLSFAAACTVKPIAVRLLVRRLAELGLQPLPLGDRPLQLFNGDLVAGGRGEVFMPV